MKRIITFLVLLFGVLSSLMAHDAVVDGIYYNLDTDNKTAWVTFRGTSYSEYLDEYSGNVEIPETIVYKDELYSVIFITNDAFHFCKNLTSVVIGNNVTSIKDWAFSGCSALSSVTIGSAVTSISDYAFNECRILDDIVIPENVTHIGNYAFRECDKLSSINIPNSGYNASFNGIFYGCENLKEVILPSKMTGIGQYVFSGCSALTSITLSENIKSIGSYAFAGCTGITSVTLPKSVNTIGANAFENCTGLKTLQIGSGVTSIGENAFNGCSSLESVTSYATTVPTVATSSFENYNAYLYVPCASKIDYDLDATFGQFKYIECVTEEEGGDDNGNDDTGGDDTSDDNTNDDNTDDTVTPTVFDTTTDQGVAFVVNPNSANPVYVPLTYSYNAEYQTAQYTGTYTITELDFTAKIGGLTSFDVINYGTNGQALQTNYLYNPTRGASNGFTITGDYKVGDILNISATFGSDWYVTLIVNVTKTLEPTPNDITLYYVNSDKWAAVNGYVWPTGGAGLLDWPGAPATKTDQTVGGYDVYSYTFDATKADNIIFNNGSGGDGNQTSDLAVDASKPYFYDGVWYETLTFDAEGGDEGGNEGGNEGGEEGGDDTGDVVVGEKADMYLVGQFSSWAFSTNYQFTQIDEDDFVLEFAQGSELQLEGQFKIASNGWIGSYDFGGNHSVDIDTDYVLTAKGANLNTAKVITVSKIAFNTTTATIRFSGVSTAKVFDVTKDYGLYLNADYIDNPFTFKGNGVYEASYTFAETSSYQFNVGDANYSSIELGAINLSDVIAFGTPYQLGETNYRLLTPVCEAGTELLFTLTITSDWTATILVTQKTTDEGGDDDTDTPAVFDTTTDQGVAFVVNPNSANPVFVPLTYSYNAEFQTAQYTGSYTVTDLDFTAKIGGLTNFDVINYGTNGQAVEAKYFYIPTRGASDGFTITGDYKVGDILNISATFGSDWYVTLIVNVTKTLEPTPNDITLYYVNSDKWAAVNGYVWPTGGAGLLDWPGAPATKTDQTVGGYDVYSYTFDATKADNIIFNNGSGGDGNQTSDLAVDASKPYFYDGVWYETLTFDAEGGDEGGNEGGEEGGDDPIVPETPAYVVRGNGGSDATGIWCGGIEWTADDSPVNNMTDADKDGIYEVTYKNVPAGTWNFKVVGTTEGWMGSDYLDTKNSSAGCTTAPYDGNIGFTLNAPTDVTIQFNTLTGKIIATTPSGSFGTVQIDHFHITLGSDDVCLDEYEFTAANNYKFTFTEDIVVDPAYGYTDVYYRIIGNCNYAVYEKHVGVNIAESGTYTLTVQFNGDYDNPEFTVTAVKQGGSDQPVVPDPVISAIVVPTFPQVEVGKTATATLTYTLENATKATATVDAPFYILSQSVNNGVGNVEILFMPETSGTYNGTLTITSGKTTQSAAISAVAVDPIPEVEASIKDLQVPAFANTYVNEASAVVATYTLENATEATASISGTGAGSFYIIQQGVTDNAGTVRIVFMPQTSGKHNATLTITSGKVSQSIDFSAIAMEYVPEPEVAISNVVVPVFATVEQGRTSNVTATFTLENATEFDATLSGEGADAFIITNKTLNNTQGSVKIAFIPSTAGTYQATLTLSAGKASHSVNFSAVATAPKPVVSITDINVPTFEEIYVNAFSAVTVTYTLVNATNATATMEKEDAFYVQNNKVTNGKGVAQVIFYPATAGVHHDVLIIEADGVSVRVDLSAVAKVENPTEPDAPISISNLQVPAFESITAKQTTTVIASYVLTGTTQATATISGNSAFSIVSQSVSEGVGRVEIEFAPTKAGKCDATLTVTAEGTTESIEFSATALPAPAITNLNVPAFEDVYVGDTRSVLATYTIENATEATATLLGDAAFTISNQSVYNGSGIARIDFAPTAEGTYNAVLVITSGVTQTTISFSATAVAEPAPEPEVVISNLVVPAFDEVYAGESVLVMATYTLENATEATATLSGDEEFSIVRSLKGSVLIQFAPTEAGTYSATLTIASGKVSESINFSATAMDKEDTELLPVISNLVVPAFAELYEGETVLVMATYTLENATEATATLSGDEEFSIVRSLKGSVLIQFAPTEAGTYSGTLTITSGKVSESIDFTAIAAELDQPVNPEDPEKPEDPDTPVVPDPLPEYPVRGYMYVVNTPDAHLERMVKYKPVSIDKVDYFLAPEKTGQKIYGYDIYKFEVRDEEMIDLWEYPNAQYTSWHIDVNVDLSATPYLANGVWYASIEEMMTWYVRYIPQWDDEASEKMIVESPNVYVATFDAFAESDDNDKYYYCLGNVEDPILKVGVNEYGTIQNQLQIPQGFKAMIYLDDTNWETAWNTYYKLVPPGDGWDKQYVDLGLTSGLCWATQNIGATEPQEEGTHFAWGEVEPKEDYSYNTYRWANLLKNNEYIKYVTDDWYGLIDFRTTLEPDDDAANVALEGKWHIPTQADVEELLRECTTEFGSYYGVNGYFVTGPNGNAIFLPAVGIKDGTGYEASTRGGDYWTSSLYENNQGYAVTLSFSLTYIDIDDMKRTKGLAIRPVIHKDYVGVEEVQSINVYAKDNTIYCEEPFEIYNVTGLNVTHLNGYLEGVYVVKTEKGNRLISVW